MTSTPWGDAEELRSRKLRPGPSSTPDAVARNQRERLFGATVAAVAEHGYEETRVADLLELSGVSRSTFYGHFGNKHDCFLATIDALIETATEIVADAYNADTGPWDERLAAAFQATIDLAVSQSAAARLVYVEIYAAGPDALERVEAVNDRLERLVHGSLRDSPERTGATADLVRALLGGLRKVIHNRLHTHREQELAALAPELLTWALGYRRPAEPLRRLRTPPRPPAEPTTNPDEERREQPRERIVTAVIELVGEKGYGAMTITDVAQRASVSLTTFYAHFDSKEAAALAALRRSARRTLQATLPAYQEAPDWPHAVGAALHSFFDYLSTQPAPVQLGFDAYGAGPEMVGRRDDLLADAETFLAEGYRQHPDTAAVAAEAIGASINALLYDHLRRRGVERLYEIGPTATYIALAPFVGSDAAGAIANDCAELRGVEMRSDQSRRRRSDQSGVVHIEPA